MPDSNIDIGSNRYNYLRFNSCFLDEPGTALHQFYSSICRGGKCLGIFGTVTLTIACLQCFDTVVNLLSITGLSLVNRDVVLLNIVTGQPQLVWLCI